MIPAIIGLDAGLAGLVAWVLITGRSDGPRTGRHDEFANPADRTDPHGTGWLAEMHAPDDDSWPHNGPGTGQLPMLPPDADPDVTLVQAHDVKYLGMTSTALVDELFEKHAPAEVADGS